MLRRILFAVLGIVAAVALVLGGVVWLFFARFYPAPPAADYPAPANALAVQRQDIDYFNRLLGMDRAFTPAARAEAGRKIATLAASGTVLDRPHLRIALMRIAALADNGHSKLGYDPAATPMELPVRAAIFSDGLYVMRAKDAAADLLGGRIVAIDGKPIGEVMRRLETLRGGTAAWRAAYASLYLTMQDMLYGVDIAPDMRGSTWTVVSPSGVTLTRRLDAYVPQGDEAYAFVKRWYSSEPLKGLTAGWRVLQPHGPLPITLQEYDTPFRRLRPAGSCAMLVQLKSNDDEDGHSIGDFLDATEADMRAHKPCAVFLDLRHDDGGNFTKTADFARSLPDFVAPGGRIVLLTGPSTFSAGIVTAVFVKAAGGERVTVLGEPVGDRLDFYAEGGRGCLPHSALCLAYATGRHDYLGACTDWRTCFWLDWYYPGRIASLKPDEAISPSFADWMAGHDPVFDRAMARVHLIVK
jgi:hypothetical protein